MLHLNFCNKATMAKCEFSKPVPIQQYPKQQNPDVGRKSPAISHCAGSQNSSPTIREVEPPPCNTGGRE